MLNSNMKSRCNEHHSRQHGAADVRGHDFVHADRLSGGVLFLLPICIILTYFTWPWFVDSWKLNEVSSNAGGLIRWPVKLLLPVGFFLMALQGVSEIIKRIAALEHVIDIEFKYEKPLQ